MSSNEKYELLIELPPGGRSRNSLGLQRGLGGFHRPVILRRVDRDDVEPARESDRFLEVLRRVCTFSHGAIGAVYELDIIEGQLYVVSEFLPGATLRELALACEADGERLPLGLALRAVRDAAYGVHYAETFTDALGNQRPVHHGALSDASVLVTFDGRLKLIDFALPSPMRSLRVMKFAAPEVLEGDPQNSRSDVFSLAALLHHLATGLDGSYGQLLAGAMSAEELPSIAGSGHPMHASLDAVIHRALQKDPHQRQPTALELARDIELVASPALFRAEACAQLVQRRFDARREKLWSVLDARSSVRMTKVMPLGEILDEHRAHHQGPAASGGHHPKLRPASRLGSAPDLPTRVEPLHVPRAAGLAEGQRGTLQALGINEEPTRLQASLPIQDEGGENPLQAQGPFIEATNTIAWPPMLVAPQDGAPPAPPPRMSGGVALREPQPPPAPGQASAPQAVRTSGSRSAPAPVNPHGQGGAGAAAVDSRRALMLVSMALAMMLVGAGLGLVLFSRWNAKPRPAAAPSVSAASRSGDQATTSATTATTE